MDLDSKKKRTSLFVIQTRKLLSSTLQKQEEPQLVVMIYDKEGNTT